jgi:hypothetical protein
VRIDLHLHSYFSDGDHSPREIVEIAKKEGLKILALADHENILGIKEAQDWGKKLEIKVLGAVEFEADFLGREIHFLAYLTDWQNEKLKKFLSRWQKTKIEQIEKMIKKLNQEGFSVSLEEVRKVAKGSIARPHLGKAIFLKEENFPLLQRKGIQTRKEFFRTFLHEGGKCYFQRKLPKAWQVISLVKEIEGMIFWAHPFSLWPGTKKRKVLKLSRIKEITIYLRKIGLDGLEIGYPFHDQKMVSGLHWICQELDLGECAGSDFHSLEMEVFNKLGGFETFGIDLNLDWLGRF